MLKNRYTRERSKKIDIENYMKFNYLYISLFLFILLK